MTLFMRGDRAIRPLANAISCGAELDAQCRPEALRGRMHAGPSLKNRLSAERGLAPQCPLLRRVQVNAASAMSPAGSASRAMSDVDAASEGAERRQGGWPRARQPSAWQAAQSVPSASSRRSVFADCEDVAGRAKADRAWPRRLLHGSSRRVDGRLAEAVRRDVQVRCAPVMAPERSVSAAIIAGRVSVGGLPSRR